MSTNPVKAIREHCIDCCGGLSSEVKMCSVTNCALHPFRFGKNPYRKTRTLTEEQKAKLFEGRERAKCNADS